MTAFVSVHAVVRDETRRQAAVAELLRAPGRHTRATVADQLAQPATELPPIYQAVQSTLGQERTDSHG